MRVGHVITFQQLEILNIRHGDQHILARYSERFFQQGVGHRYVLDHLKEEYRIEALVRKRKVALRSNHGQARGSCNLQILKVDIAAHALPAFRLKRQAIGAIAASKIEDTLPGVSGREPNKRPVMFTDLCRQAGLIDVVTRAQHGPAIINARIPMRHRILLATALVYLCAANIYWIAVDTRPPFWDTAGHASWALGAFRDFQQNGLAAFRTLPHHSGSYPPLYHAVTAGFYGLLGASIDAIDAAQLANLPAIVLLGLATYGIARSLMDAAASALAAILANFLPFMLWLSRETLIEYCLTAMVAASIWALLKTKEFSDTKWSLLFGALCGLGMLTKWTFIVFVAAPAFWSARKNWTNALKAAAVTAAVASYWYLPQFATLPKFWQLNVIAAENERDPTIFSIQGLLFYIRALEGSQLFLPLFVAFLAGAFVVVRNWRTCFPKWTPLTLWLLGSWLGLMLLPNRDPRYSAPALPAVAVIAAAAFEKRRAAQPVLVGFLIFQHVLVSFGIPQLPERVVLMKGEGGPIPFDWNLYSQTYFELWGKPERQDWQIERVLQTVSGSGPVRLGLIPDLPRFDVPAFQFYIDLEKYPVVISRQLSANPEDILQKDYILMSHEDRAIFGYPGPQAKEINNYIADHPERFRIVDTFTLPNGMTISLYRCAR